MNRNDSRQGAKAQRKENMETQELDIHVIESKINIHAKGPNITLYRVELCFVTDQNPKDLVQFNNENAELTIKPQS